MAIKETHISVTEEVKAMLKEIAKRETRTMRAVIYRLVKEEYEKGGKNG
jgi:hypothetical protein